jgi:hypothetical protein
MTQMLPTPREAGQMLRLRSLRVQRAREACAKAKLEVDKAHAAVKERQRAIERSQREMANLAAAIVTTLAPALPRWSGMVAANRERLADQLERDEYALIDDEHELEQAQERAQQAGAELTRALAREDAVRGLAQQARKAVLHAREQRVELEIEDQGRPARCTVR